MVRNRWQQYKMRNWTLTYLIFFPLTILAQADIKNSSLIDSKLDILYSGIENRIIVSGLENDTTLKLISSTGEVLESKWDNDPNIFIVKAGFADADTLKLYHADKLMLARVYQVKKIGNPIPQLGYITDTKATSRQILENPILNVVIPDCFYDHRIQIFYFIVTIYKANGNTLKKF